MELIKLKGVSKSFRKNQVIQDINLSINEGLSGGGKTTLLNIIAGFVHPTDGEVVYVSKVTNSEKNLHKNLSKIKRHIGYTPQHNSFYPKLSVQENLFHFGKLYNLKHETLVGNIRNLLNFTHLIDHRNVLAEHLSGGMQKRLDISCSLVHKPKILILDEPTSDLDPILQQEILQLMKGVNQQGVTVIFASHHLEGVESVSSKIAMIHKGKLHAYGSLDEFKKPYTKDHLTINVQTGYAKDRMLSQLQQLPVNKIVDLDNKLEIYPDNVEETVKYLISVSKEENLDLHDLDLRKPTLGEVFLRIAR